MPHLGICGEHGGDPTSVEFFHKTGLHYVSCSPYRVPIARLAAEAQLTAREHEVLGLLAEGRSAPFIAEYLSIERSTAKTHVARIYAKLGVHTRQELISLVLSAKGLGSAER